MVEIRGKNFAATWLGVEMNDGTALDEPTDIEGT